MKKFEVILTKSYILTIHANNEDDAKDFAEFYTSDVKDISTKEDKLKDKFEIINIECKINEASNPIVVYEKN